MKKNYPIKLLVNNWIIINIIYFREANPNYTRISIDKSDKESLLFSS